eukprot:3877056-Amphidinium_carterae.1
MVVSSDPTIASDPANTWMDVFSWWYSYAQSHDTASMQSPVMRARSTSVNEDFGACPAWLPEEHHETWTWMAWTWSMWTSW